VKDPAVAEKLIPNNHGFGTRRVPLESGYFEVYNQPNVTLVDLTETPIERITPTGITTSDAEYAFDIIIYATGFDAITGAFDRIDIRGVDGVSLKERWQDGPQTFLGILGAGLRRRRGTCLPSGAWLRKDFPATRPSINDGERYGCRHDDGVRQLRLGGLLRRAGVGRGDPAGPARRRSRLRLLMVGRAPFQ